MESHQSFTFIMNLIKVPSSSEISQYREFNIVYMDATIYLVKLGQDLRQIRDILQKYYFVSGSMVEI